MKIGNPGIHETPLNEVSRRKMLANNEHFFLSDWQQVVFIHYEVEPKIFQALVPFELDLYDGKAYVSCVAFYLRRLRPVYGGAIGALLMKPIANHEFLNVRTYVRHKGERGIYFLAEFLPNLLSAQLGPPFCGLPYRYAKLRYAHEGPLAISGEVQCKKGRLVYNGAVQSNHCVASAEGSLDEFLLERYTAFTWRKGVSRLFRVWHPTWQFYRASLEILEDGLLGATGNWAKEAIFVGAQYSPGFGDVWMGYPRKTPASCEFPDETAATSNSTLISP